MAQGFAENEKGNDVIREFGCQLIIAAFQHLEVCADRGRYLDEDEQEEVAGFFSAGIDRLIAGFQLDLKPHKLRDRAMPLLAKIKPIKSKAKPQFTPMETTTNNAPQPTRAKRGFLPEEIRNKIKVDALTMRAIELAKKYNIQPSNAQRYINQARLAQRTLKAKEVPIKGTIFTPEELDDLHAKNEARKAEIRKAEIRATLGEPVIIKTVPAKFTVDKLIGIREAPIAIKEPTLLPPTPTCKPAPVAEPTVTEELPDPVKPGEPTVIKVNLTWREVVIANSLEWFVKGFAFGLGAALVLRAIGGLR